MASVNIQQEILAESKAVWEVIADFGGVQKILDPQRIKSSSADGNEVGAVRTITLIDDSQILEKIEYINNKEQRLIYSIVGKCPLPVKDYVATAKVTRLTENLCQIDWQSTFEPIGDAASAEQVISSLYLGGVEKMKEIFDKH
jgi:hypothetical protein